MFALFKMNLTFMVFESSDESSVMTVNTPLDITYQAVQSSMTFILFCIVKMLSF